MRARRLTLRSSGLLFLSILAGPALAQPLAMADTNDGFSGLFGRLEQRQQDIVRMRGDAYAPQPAEVDTQGGTDARLRPQVVPYLGHERPGTVIIDTPNTYLYFVMGGGRALRYGIGVGRDGFRWSGTQNITRKSEWPDWTPPPEMVQRQPYLPRFMAGGTQNPLGARAMYLGNTIYRIHGTNDPSTIGKRVSSGCIRLTNDDVVDLYSRVGVGTRVVVLPDTQHHYAADMSRRTAVNVDPVPAAADARLARNRALSGLY
jgi:lipoprotein-anchoring transpeptidase ErfK/SrfK